MALIKCNECGKEISNKAKTCPNCGNPIFSEKVKTMNKKKWEDLSNEERYKIGAYRKTLKQWYEINRVMVLVCIVIAMISSLIFCISGTDNITSMFIVFIAGCCAVFFSFNSLKEQKKWYEDNIDKLYEKEILK